MNSELLTNIFVALISSGIVGTIVTAVVTRRKIAGESKNLDVDASKKQVDTSLDLVESYRKAYEEISAKLSKLQTDMDALTQKFDILNQENNILKLELQNLASENTVLKVEKEELRGRVTNLEMQLVSLGEKPVNDKKK